MPHPPREQPMRVINETHLWKEERHAYSGRIEHDVHVMLQCVKRNMNKKIEKYMFTTPRIPKNDTMILHW